MKVNYADYLKKTDVSVLVAEAIFSELFKSEKIKTIYDIATTSSGGTPLRGNNDFYNGRIPWLKSGELNDGYIEKAEEFITEEGLSKSSAKLFPEGTLLLAMYGATAGKTGITKIKASTNQAVCAIFPNEELKRDFLYWFFRQHRYKYIEISKGGAQPNISQTVINQTHIPIPEISIQERIIKVLFSIQKNATLDLTIIPKEYKDAVVKVFQIKKSATIIESENLNQLDLLKKLRQQILQDAVQGKLVLQDPNDEPVSKLLERIKAEKEQLIREKKIKKGKPLPEIKPEEIPFEIPANWVWCRLGEIGSINPRNIVSDDLDVSFIPMNLISERFGIHPYFETRKWKGIKSGFTHFANNDVAIAKITPCFENSKACVFKNLMNGYGAGTTELHVFRSYNNFLLPEYIYANLKTNKFLINGERIMRGVAGQKRVPTEYFRDFLIPLPPTKEQFRIYSKIVRLMTLCNELEQSIQQNQKYTQDLLQVALKEALEPK